MSPPTHHSPLFSIDTTHNSTQKIRCRRFKKSRRNLAFSIHGDTLFYVRDKSVRSYDFPSGSDFGLLSVRKFGSPYVPLQTLSYNPAERAVVITVSSNNGLYKLSTLPTQTNGDIKDSSADSKRGSAHSAIFVARNRLAVLQKTNQVSLTFFLSDDVDRFHLSVD